MGRHKQFKTLPRDVAVVLLVMIVIVTSARRHEKCYLPPAEGNCQEKILSWYFDNSTGQCQTFLYSGCGGNANNFNSTMYCLHACNASIDERHTYSLAASTELIKGQQQQNVPSQENVDKGPSTGSSESVQGGVAAAPVGLPTAPAAAELASAVATPLPAAVAASAAEPVVLSVPAAVAAPTPAPVLSASGPVAAAPTQAAVGGPAKTETDAASSSSADGKTSIIPGQPSSDGKLRNKRQLASPTEGDEESTSTTSATGGLSEDITTLKHMVAQLSRSVHDLQYVSTVAHGNKDTKRKHRRRGGPSRSNAVHTRDSVTSKSEVDGGNEEGGEDKTSQKIASQEAQPTSTATKSTAKKPKSGKATDNGQKVKSSSANGAISAAGKVVKKKKVSYEKKTNTNVGSGENTQIVKEGGQSVPQTAGYKKHQQVQNTRAHKARHAKIVAKKIEEEEDDDEDDGEIQVIGDKITSIIGDPSYSFSCNNISNEDLQALNEVAAQSDFGAMRLQEVSTIAPTASTAVPVPSQQVLTAGVPTSSAVSNAAQVPEDAVVPPVTEGEAKTTV